jgi:hypothetical protein
MESISQLFLVVIEFDGNERCWGDFEKDKSKTEESLWARKPIIYTYSLETNVREPGRPRGRQHRSPFLTSVAWAVQCFRIAQLRATWSATERKQSHGFKGQLGIPRAGNVARHQMAQISCKTNTRRDQGNRETS